ncbi:Ig-like domain-containing protein [Pseudomonas sp. URMO17WK12:I11]|uniref:Ig-like domain-containing protein n=1 Tax=Pseudomonas sp. URMO17WK12:I11 TaxID=1283291 RepID=UPI0007222EEB|nr:Ig-like domain-containing protein [Pseudomonas sp. URMO17WK12:I11]CRL51644.1 hypothetical protein PSHI_48370 [Pseudomonas sp. URMO17WK12:I11]
MSISVSVVDGNAITSTQDLSKVSKGKPVRIKAIKDGKYILAEGENGFAPENVTVKRVGKNLHVALEGTDPDEPELIIEDFFEHEGQLVGMSEDSTYYEYVAVDGDHDSQVAFLIDGVSSAQALGANALTGFGAGLVMSSGGILPTYGLGLGALGALGAGAVFGGSGGGGGGGGGGSSAGGSNNEAIAPPSKASLATIIDDVGAIQGVITNGGSTDDTTPTLSGKGEPGSFVHISDNGGLLGSVLVDGNGNWSFTPGTPLIDGEHSFTVVSEDKAGNKSEPSDGYVVIVDTFVPEKPSVGGLTGEQGPIASGESTDDTQPILSGEGNPGDTVTIIDNGNVIGEVQIGEDGKWEFTPESPLAEGEHVFEVVITDPAGNASEPSDEFVVIIDTVAPEKPSVGGVTDEQGPVASGESTDDTQPTLSGEGNPGDTVTIIDNGNVIGEVQIGEDGKWEFTPEAPLAEGEHVFEVVITDPVGNASEPSDEFVVIIDTIAPEKPSVGGVTDEQGPVGSGESTDDTQPTLSGEGNPGDTVTIIDNGNVIGEVQIGEDGKWEFTPEAPLAEGEHIFEVVITDPAGNASEPSEEYVVIVDTQAPSETTGVLKDDVGTVQGPINAGDTTDDSTPTFSGQAEPNAEVVIYDHGVEIGRVPTDDAGNWSFTPSTPLADGEHSFSTQVIDPAGNAGEVSDAIDFSVDTRNLEVSIDQVADNVGSKQGNLSKGNVTDDTTPTLSGKAAAGGTVKLYDAGVLLGSVVADSSGNWSFTAPELGNGAHELTATVTTDANGESAPTAIFDLTVDTVAPGKPGIDAATDDVGALQSPVSNGGSTDDTTPTLSGKGEPGSTVHISDNGGLLGSVLVDGNGNWSFTPGAPLIDGEHSFTVVSEDLAGNTSEPSAAYVVIVSTVEPAAPSIESIYDDQGDKQGNLLAGDTTDDAKPTLGGKAEANSEVVIFDNGVEIGRAPVDAAGNWSFTPDVALADGEHSFTVVNEDKAGNASEPSAAFVVIVDTIAPEKPSVGGITDDQGPIESGESTDDTQPTLSGEGNPGDTVTIIDNGNVIGEVQIGEDGKWEFTPEAPLAEGEHVFEVVITDPAGNASAPSDEFVVIIDTIAPEKPSVGGITDEQGPVASGESTDDTQPTLSGEGIPGDTVTIIDNGNVIGEVQIGEDGKWEFTPEAPLAEGEHVFEVVITDPAGNASEPSEEYVVIVDTQAPSETTGVLKDDVGTVQGLINAGDTTDDSTPTFSGQAEPNAEVVIYDNGVEIGRVPADDAGNWSFTPSTPLVDGEHSFSTQVIDSAGNAGEVSDAIDFSVDTSNIEVSIDQVADNVGSKQGNLSKGDVTDDTTPTLSGKAKAGGTVKVYDAGVLLGSVVADASGNWSFTAPELGNGTHELTATVTTDANGESAPTAIFDLTVDTVAPEKPSVGGVTDERGPVASGESTDDTQPTLGGEGNPGDTVTIIDNSNVIGEVQIGEDGKWEFTPEAPLAEGEHVFEVVITDPAGNASEPSEEYVVIVDTVAPTAPSIESVYDDQGDKQGAVLAGEATDDAQPTLSGKAEANSQVVIFDKGVEIGRAPVDAAGNWSFTPAVVLAEGEHSFTVVNEDQVGNASEPSTAYVVIVDTVAPEKPILGGVTDEQGPVASGESTNDTQPTLSGEGNPGDTVTLIDNGNIIGEVLIGEDGKWEITPEAPLAEGEHVFEVVVTDPAGNISEPSDEYVVVIDTTAPLKPGIDAVSDDVGALQGPVGNGGSTDDTTPTLTGRGEPGSTVHISDNAGLLGSVVVDSNGNWSFTPDPALAEGEHSFTVVSEDQAGNKSAASAVYVVIVTTPAATKPSIESVYDDQGAQKGNLISGDTTDDNRPTLSGKAEAGSTVVVEDKGVEIGRVTADGSGNWSFTPSTPLADGEHSFSAVVVSQSGERSPVSDSIDLVIKTGPTQVAYLSHMGKDSGHDGNDFITNNGTYGRLLQGVLSAELTPGLKLQVSHDGGKTWSDALVDGTNWVSQDRSAHVSSSWVIQTRVVDQFGASGTVTQQAVVLDVMVPRALASIELVDTHLQVGFNPSHVRVGERIAVVADGGAHRFEYTLTQEDVAAGFVKLEVGSISSVSAAVVTQGGNVSDFVTIGQASVGVTTVLTGEITEVYGLRRDDIFSVDDVSVLGQIDRIDGNRGVDALNLLGTDQVLDLSAVVGRLSSIEVIDLTGTGNNTVKVSLGDVLELGNHRAFTSDDTAQLAVKGNTGDVVLLSDLLPNGMDVGDWEALGPLTASGIVYEVYQHTVLDAQLLVQDGVMVQLQ